MSSSANLAVQIHAFAATHNDPAERTRGLILVVDDDMGVAQSLRRTLKREHDCVIVLSAIEALARLDAGEQFDGALCDLMMPDMTGMEFHDQLKLRHPRLAERTIFMTGGAFTDRAKDFLETVPNARIEKPFEPQQLRVAVATMLGRPVTPLTVVPLTPESEASGASGRTNSG